MTVVKSTDSRSPCHEPLIEMIKVQNLFLAYHNSEQVYELGLKPVFNGITCILLANYHWLLDDSVHGAYLLE